jgi:hypothetical protein
MVRLLSLEEAGPNFIKDFKILFLVNLEQSAKRRVAFVLRECLGRSDGAVSSSGRHMAPAQRRQPA